MNIIISTINKKIKGINLYYRVLISLFLLISVYLFNDSFGPNSPFLLLYLIPIIFSSYYIKNGYNYIVASLSSMLNLNLVTKSSYVPENIFLIDNYISNTVIYFVITFLIQEIRKTMDKLERMIKEDPLTGAIISSFFYEEIKKQLPKIQNNDDSISVIVIDIDNFERFNEFRGHLAGDEFLIDVVNVINSTIKNNGIVARIGGDEFAILIKHNNKNVIEEIISDLRYRLNVLTIDHDSNTTFSIGALIYSGKDIMFYDDLVNVSKDLMKLIKRTSKDNVECKYID